jgi:sec-independent protein translocase protein TatB
MFDISFFELMVIGIVGLVVIGPERLPRVARTAGHMFGRLQRYVTEVKAEINREVEMEDLRKIQSDFYQAARSVESSVNASANAVTSELNATAAEASSGLSNSGTPRFGAVESQPSAVGPVAAAESLVMAPAMPTPAVDQVPATVPYPAGNFEHAYPRQHAASSPYDPPADRGNA